MKKIGNFFWCILLGWWLCILFFIYGIVLCITIILIPIGIQYFKLAKFIILPFGKTLKPVNVTGFKTFLNIFGAILGGWASFLLLGFIGVIFHITIIGIPIGKIFYRCAKFSIMPLGHDFVPIEAAN